MAKSNSNPQWIPIVFTNEGEQAGMHHGRNIQLEPTATEQEATAMARQACKTNSSAIGFTIKPYAAAMEGGAA